MRKITRESVEAFLEYRKFRKQNMSVRIIEDKAGEKIALLLLHGNLIAKVSKKGLYITNAGWKTNTTRERLNGLPAVSISQKNYIWYLNGKEWNGELTKIN